MSNIGRNQHLLELALFLHRKKGDVLQSGVRQA
jgi:hypothetical protein